MKPFSQCTSALALAILLTVPGASAQEKVGVASAVNPNAAGTPPGLATRTLLLGTDIVHNERVATTDAGQAEIQFIDRSSFSVGPGSDLVIDDFVYDPNAGTGKLAASATKGVFRFVGGALSKTPEGVSLKTPSATIGLRGGIALIAIGTDGSTTATFLYGKEMTVTSGGVTTRAYRPNSVITATSANTPPSQPTLAPSGQVGSTLQALDGRQGTNGGASQVPTDTTLEASTYPQTNSQDVEGANAAAQSHDGNATTSSQQNSPGLTPIIVPPTDIIQTAQIAGATDQTQTVDLPPDGPQTPVTSMPAQGSAFFSGDASGTLNNVHTTGFFQQDWDFGRRTGSVQIFNFGGASFSGAVSSGQGASNAFSGSITGSTETSGSASGSINGTFRTINNIPANQVQGTFSASGGFTAQGSFRANQASPP